MGDEGGRSKRWGGGGGEGREGGRMGRRRGRRVQGNTLKQATLWRVYSKTQTHHYTGTVPCSASYECSGVVPTVPKLGTPDVVRCVALIRTSSRA